MTIKFNQKNLEKFKQCFPSEPSQGAVGKTPSLILRHTELPKDSWPNQYPINKQASRDTIRAICRDREVDEKAAYVCAMAWGGLDKRNMLSALQSPALVAILQMIRQCSNRMDAFYSLSRAWKEKLIVGMRVSFFTKLPYFFLPEENAYILDQWTAKSANLLWENCPVPMNRTGTFPDPDTSPDQYESYCLFTEELAREMKWSQPISAEIAMFGKNENGINNWRRHVKAAWQVRENEPQKDEIAG